MNCLIYIPKCLAASVGNLNDCGSNDRVAELIALCEHFDDNILADILILDMHDSRVDIRVERVALGAERLNVERFENIAELPVYLLDSLAVAVGIRLSVHRRALKIIYDREKLLTTSVFERILCRPSRAANACGSYRIPPRGAGSCRHSP